MNRLIITLITFTAFVLSCININAQCKIENTYFKAGEHLSYDLYFKYGIIYTKAGSSTLTVKNDTYNGENVYKTALAAKLNGLASKVYSLSDTLSAYLTKDVVPLAYSKDAHEDGDYNTERATFTYTDGKIHARNISRRNGKLRYDTTHVVNSCIYDMVSILYYARTINYNSMKKGDKVTVQGLVGRRTKNMDIIYQGIETIKANDDREYYCIKLSIQMNDDAFANKEEAMKVFLSNDSNRIPIRIDSKLKIGSTRVILNKYSGLNN